MRKKKGENINMKKERKIRQNRKKIKVDHPNFSSL